MKANSPRALLATLLCGGLLAATAAHADRGDWDGPGRGWGHYKHHHHHRYDRDYDRGPTVIRERVIVRERPSYYYDPPVVHNYYYSEPVRTYRYSRSPAIVVGVDIPPLVIPLR
ncbi:MAG: hypothetical protein JSR42_15095 [Proteobacteria bacterium]|nr:hypothetical protein [Pseudomonadota bacterium]MBS0551296.1 hypothetical protein [Pseudomonadota bacterium]